MTGRKINLDEQSVKHRKRNLVTIKGSNDGLSFILNDKEPFSLVAENLKQKIRRELSTLLTGPMVRIKIDCGNRVISDKQRQLLEEIVSLKDNLILTRINSSSEAIDSIDDNAKPIVHMIDEQNAYIYRGTVRSGQELEHDGNIVIVGDINSGAKVMATGDILVLGKIAGYVHAGCIGDKERVIVGASWGNAQVRIADCIGKSQALDMKSHATYLSTAYLDEYRIVFKHK
jgi:septum site-determining protein MinC